MELLSKISNVELWKVRDSHDELLTTTDWLITSDGATVTSKIGEFSWRLDSSLHCLKAEERSFVFAIDPQNSLFYCANIPKTVSTDDIAILETVLDSFTTYEIQPAPEKPDRTEQFIGGINRATTTVVAGMTATAIYVGDKIKKGAEKYRERRAPCEQPRQISETTKKRIQQIKNVAKTTSGLASAAVDAVSVFTSKAADAIVGDRASDPKKATTKAKRVAAAVVVSAAEIYEGMVDAFITVSQRTAEAATDVVTHRYGAEAGEVSRDSLAAVGHSANAVISSTKLGTKAILKTAAKKTAIGYMSNSGSQATSSSTQ